MELSVIYNTLIAINNKIKKHKNYNTYKRIVYKGEL